MKLIIGYLAATVAANLAVTTFGKAAAIIIAFVAIGFDLTCRDALHDRWHGRYLFLKMAALIVAGSLISFLLNQDSLRVGVASLVAFLSAGAVDTVVYTLLRRHNRFTRVNGSNLASAGVDSVLFPTIAFGGFDPVVTVGQFAGKVFGGWLWSLLLRRFFWDRDQEA